MWKVAAFILVFAHPVIAALGPYTAMDLGAPAHPGEAWGMKIDDNGRVYGPTDTGNFVWENGVMSATGGSPIKDPLLWGQAINSAGHWISNTAIPGHGAFWDGTNYIDLGWGAAYEINNLSQVVGYNIFPAGHQPARVLGYLWEPGQGFTHFGTLGGGESIALGINERGIVVGQSYISGNIAHRPFVWYRGQMMELPTPDGISTTEAWAYSINEKGHIAGMWNVGSSSQTTYHAVLWVPEPATFFLTCTGSALLLFAGGARHKKRR